jgi:hypothetical protein
VKGICLLEVAEVSIASEQGEKQGGSSHRLCRALQYISEALVPHKHNGKPLRIFKQSNCGQILLKEIILMMLWTVD